MHHICRVLNIALAYDDSGKYLILLGCAPKEDGGYKFLEKREFTDPIEAWTNYWQSVDCMVRRRIQDGKIKEKM